MNDEQPNKSPQLNNKPIKQDKIFKHGPKGGPSAWFWLLIIIGILVIGLVLFMIFNKKDNGQKNVADSLQRVIQTGNTKEVKLKSIGFNLEYHDPATNKAGDIEFVKFKPPYDRVFVDYGQILSAQYSAERKESKNVHPSIMLPAGTKLSAPIDGIVASVRDLYSGDYSIQISADGKESSLTFGLEHVKNPTVKAGYSVKAGDIIAEVTDFTSEHHPGYGYFDLAVFSSNKDGQPQHHCPFLYLDDSIKEEVFAKIRALYTSWEKFTGDNSMYDENTYTAPGCITTEPIDG